MKKYRVGILGATGAVGQKFVELLAEHPWFEVTALAASARSAGKKYQEATNWIGSTPIPAHLKDQIVVLADPKNVDADFVFSGMDADFAGEIERDFALAGIPVISNAKNYRMEDNVPLLIPEVNANHIELVKHQNWGGKGFIVTNPNCSTVGMVSALMPFVKYGIEVIQVTTMQALSGAGYPGVASLDILGNVVPFIGGEEAKMEIESKKLLGTLNAEATKVDFADFKISAQCNRVPVLDGHTETVSIKLKNPPSLEQLIADFKTFESPIAHLNLPSAPNPFIQVFEDERFPQPRRHANLGNGMTVSVGRLRACPVNDFKFVVLAHNTVRGAAGGAILNAELFANKGLI